LSACLPPRLEEPILAGILQSFRLLERGIAARRLCENG
jgi:hypothetical protein